MKTETSKKERRIVKKWGELETARQERDESRELANDLLKHILANKLYALDVKSMGFRSGAALLGTLVGKPNNIYVRLRGREGNYTPEPGETPAQTVKRFWSAWNAGYSPSGKVDRVSDELDELIYNAYKSVDGEQLTAMQIAEAMGVSRQTVWLRAKAHEDRKAAS